MHNGFVLDGLEKNNKEMISSDIYISLAAMVGTKSSCLRRKYGCVIVKGDKILSYGYNVDVMPRIERCNTVGTCWRDANNIPHGERYEACKSVHAEQNAIINANKEDLNNSIAYLVGYDCKKGEYIEGVPCYICRKLLYAAGVYYVITVRKNEDGGYDTVKSLVNPKMDE